MTSPFPGMDPYLERHWRDIHARLVLYASDAVNGRLPNGLVSRVEERIAVESETRITKVYYPDVRIERTPRDDNGGGVAVEAPPAVAEPYTLISEEELATEPLLHIVGPNGELVTVIEFLSPANKRQPGLDDYVGKRATLLSAGVNVVEVDLVRAGDYLPLLKGSVVEPELRTMYRAMTRRRHMTHVHYFPLPRDRRLSVLPIPLRDTDADVPLDLQAILNQAYTNGRYAQTLDYSVEPDPPFNDDDRAWADALLREKGRRGVTKTV